MATILILDDRATNREFLQSLLGYAEHKLYEADNAETALDITRRVQPDLVIADVLMPDIDGFEFVRRLRADPLIAKTRVIFYTAAYMASEVHALATACGVSHVLTKPADPMVILETIRTALGEPTTPMLPIASAFERDHQRLLVDKLDQKINELEVVNDELRTSRAQLLIALDVGGFGIWTVDLLKNQLVWDDTSLTIWGRNRAEASINTLESALQYVHPDDQSQVFEIFSRLLAEQKETSDEFRIQLDDQSIRWIALRARVERDAENQPIQLIAVHQDITNQKHAEEAQIRSQKLEALGTLIGGIAHDFNNILLAINANAEIGAEELPAEHPVQQNLGEISKAGGRATDLIRRILTFSRPQEQLRTILSLAPVVTDALSLIRAAIPASISVYTEFSPDLPMINADSTQIHQIVINLVTNAAYAIRPNPGNIRIAIDHIYVDTMLATIAKLFVQGSYVRLTVQDTGSGMDSATIARIFDPFFTTKPVGQGTGLGLPVVHGIMKSHGGAVIVNSTLGHGTTFQLFFPAARPSHNLGFESEPPLAKPRGQRILCIDDEPAIVQLVTHILARSGFQPVGCDKTSDALALFEAEAPRFHAVVTDLMMAGLSGLEAAQRIRAIRADIPIILTAGYIRPEDEETARNLGINSFVPKSRLETELVTAVSRVLA